MGNTGSFIGSALSIPSFGRHGEGPLPPFSSTAAISCSLFVPSPHDLSRTGCQVSQPLCEGGSWRAGACLVAGVPHVSVAFTKEESAETASETLLPDRPDLA